MEKVLLFGMHSQVGLELYEELKEHYELYTFTSFDQDDNCLDIEFLKADIFNLQEVIEALKEIDVVVFYDDPIMRLSRLTQSRFQDLIRLVADTIGRASKISGVEQIIYVRDQLSDTDLLDILGAHGTPVTMTETKIKREGKSLNYRTHKRKEYRSANRSIIPEGWTLEDVANYYFHWIGNIVYDMISVEMTDDTVQIYLSKVSSPALEFEKNQDESCQGIVVYDVVSGFLVNKSKFKAPRFEFRELKGKGEFILAIHDFQPSIPWGLFVISHAQIQALINRIYRVEMIINDKK